MTHPAPIAGTAEPFDQDRERARVELMLSRANSPASMFNHGTLTTRADWTDRFREITCPVLVIHGEGAFQQQDDLAGERFYARLKPRIPQHGTQPSLDPLLVRAARDDRRMARQVDQFHQCPQETAALACAAAGGTGQIVEDGLDLVGQIALGPRGPMLESCKMGLVPHLQPGGDQIVLLRQ